MTGQDRGEHAMAIDVAAVEDAASMLRHFDNMLDGRRRALDSIHRHLTIGAGRTSEHLQDGAERLVVAAKESITRSAEELRAVRAAITDHLLETTDTDAAHAHELD